MFCPTERQHENIWGHMHVICNNIAGANTIKKRQHENIWGHTHIIKQYSGRKYHNSCTGYNYCSAERQRDVIILLFYMVGVQTVLVVPGALLPG